MGDTVFKTFVLPYSVGLNSICFSRTRKITTVHIFTETSTCNTIKYKVKLRAFVSYHGRVGAADDAIVVKVEFRVGVRGFHLFKHLSRDIGVAGVLLEEITVQVLVVDVPVLAPRTFPDTLELQHTARVHCFNNVVQDSVKHFTSKPPKTATGLLKQSRVKSTRLSDSINKTTHHGPIKSGLNSDTVFTAKHRKDVLIRVAYTVDLYCVNTLYYR